MATLEQDLQWFAVFAKTSGSSVELREARVSRGRDLVLSHQFRRAPLPLRVEFLRWLGLERSEIESAFESGDPLDYEQVLLMDEQGGLRSEHTAPETQQTDESHLGAASGVMKVAEGFWRIGSTVLAYRGNMCYYPTPLLGFELSRAEDVIKIAHQKPTGEYDVPTFLPPGFKGVVPDEYPMHCATRVGMTVLVRDPEESGKERFREAVVLRMTPEDRDGQFELDIEWTHTSTVQSGVDSRDCRLLYHPKVLIHRLAEQEEAARRAQGANERMDSAGAFLCVGELSRAEQLRIAREKRELQPEVSTGDVDPSAITTHIKSYMHFPHLDVFEQPRDLRTGATFISQYGDAAMEGAPRTVPLYPACQQTRSGSGFRFNLQHLESYGRSIHHLKHNPVAVIAEQCIKNGSMFVDPYFPPSEYSLLGPEALSNDTSRGEVTWRRLSEIYYRPRLQALGSKAVSCSPGRFAPPWFTEMLGAFQLTTESEDITSPGDDGWLFGVYALRLFVEGRWGFVVVDDFVPCDPSSGEPIGIDARSPSDIQWALIEKALAKLQGSYKGLQVTNPGFSLPRVWEDLTSNVTDVIEHEHLSYKEDVCSNLCDIVLEEHNSCCVLARVGSTRYSGFGAEEGALWHVDCVAEYVAGRDAASTFSFHVVRRTPGPPVKRIEQVREQLLEEIGRAAALQLPEVPASEVSFWMSSAEYFAMFDRTYCLRIMNNFQKLSVNASFAGRRDLGGKADGHERLLRNPQYLLSFMQPTECILELQLADRRLDGGEAALPAKLDAATLQLHLIKGHAAERPWSAAEDGDPQFVASTPLIDLGEDIEWRNHPSVTVRLPLPGGNYILVPTVGHESTEPFTIKVFSVSAFYVKLLN